MALSSGITVSDLSFSYPRDRVVFDHVGWVFVPGLMHAVMGPSGSGKTTLFRLICGEIRPETGMITVGDDDMARVDSVLVRRSLVARVYQDYRLVPYLDALDNVRLPQEIAGTLKDEPDKAARLLEQLGLKNHLHDAAGTLSGGEQQRVAIARALVSSPKVILADEPTGALDEDATVMISDLLVSVAHDWGVTVVVVTHDDAVARRADSVVHIHHHQLVGA